MVAEIRACTAEDFEQILGLLEQLWPDKTMDHDRLRAVFRRALSEPN